jgi:ATP-binding protein involved in chromosome partitioning
MNNSSELPQISHVLEALSVIVDPDFQKNIVELGFVQNLSVRGAEASFDLVLTTPACPHKETFVAKCEELLKGLGFEKVTVNLQARPAQKPQFDPEKSLLKNVKKIIGVASGKGGVGKSTVTANLAATASLAGLRVGVLDADLYGPSMGILFTASTAPQVNDDGTLVPAESKGVQIATMAHLAPPSSANIWRGPRASQMVQNLLHSVHWGELDVLFVDFPPGTGDIQLTLAQSAKMDGVVLVSTPQEMALADCRKALAMFREVGLPVLGVVENMAYFACGSCGERHHPFGAGGAARLADELKIPLLAELPLEPFLQETSDAGVPIPFRAPNSETAKVFREVLERVLSK